MVQFNKLRLSGFKSFVDQTELLISSGMTGIVGPNGCGKSNLVEALRWVMGETSAKRMRGSEMDDVIFAGSATRPARNIAEVSLILDNRDRTAPAAFNEYDDIEVVRRISRGSGSNYKVNGKDVRARDVQLLFADAASGSQSTALVSQGRIGEIINAKPTSRRGLLEEAAGITGLHSRRHEAELRLRAAETNLERLEDVITTLDTQLQGLKKQARQANRYRNLAQLIRQHEAILLHYESVDAKKAQSDAIDILKSAQKDVSEKTTITAQKSRIQVDITASLPALREAETSQSSKHQRLLINQETLQREEEQAINALNKSTELLVQLKKDRERATNINADALEAEERLKQEKIAIEDKNKSVHTDQQDLEAECKKHAQTISKIDNSISEINSQIAANEAQSTALRRRQNELKELINRQSSQLRQQEAQHKHLASQQESRASLIEAERDLEAAEQRLNQAKEASDKQEKDVQDKRQAEEQARDSNQETQNQLNEISAEIRALNELLRGTSSSITHPILDELSVKTGYEKALGAALGEDLNAGSEEEAVAHWHDIPMRTDLPTLPEGIISLLNFVQSPDRLHARLSQIGLVETPSIDEELYSQLAPGQRLVSKEGTLWRWDGLTVRDDAPSTTAVRLEYKNRLKGLEKEKVKIESHNIKAKEHFIAAKQALDKSLENEKLARQTLNNAHNEVSTTNNQHTKLAQKHAKLVSQLSAVEENLQRLIRENLETTEQQKATTAEIDALPDQKQEKEQLVELQRKLSTERSLLGSQRGKLEQIKRDVTTRRERLVSIANELSSWSRRTKEAKQYLGEIDIRIKRTEAEIEIWKTKPEEINKQTEALATVIAQSETEKNKASETLRSAELEQAEADRQLRESEQLLAQAREAMIRAESTVEQNKQAMAILIDRVRERLGCSLEKALSIADIQIGEDLPPRDEVTRKHDRLTNERNNMGPVNLRAEQEAEELDQQIKSMLNDKEDLLLAIGKLRQGIANLNKEGRERLLKAFDRVNAHFSDLFVRLFGGGRAHLTLTEAEDPLQAGLEIMASPPGKRLQVMSLLSGGEQALTALSLLFAVFLTNPAPICVLDEVDAPLDDANVDRFCKLVEELVHSTSTRFLIISHHRMTMARVRRLFGVTMSERGISQLVSVNLEAADDLMEKKRQS
ncbi:chromosome segregation protein SMC [Kiloniella sp. EL199]|uniref:chromosome segregation protein SMC n=1 Tax=Kiloniella sp. EL199 TaxID=2107581 RepID=UPI0013C4C978|nr:chromosome segregation protein SMC [Kiloniella sp. EL199]